MIKSAILIMAIFCLLGASVVMAANVAIDEDFDAGTLFQNWNGTMPSTQTSTVQGVNIQIASNIIDGVAYGGAGAPITYTNDATAGAIVAIDATHNCYALNPGKTLQFGSMDGTVASRVNGNIPCWADGNAVVQAALAIDTSALGKANNTVVGKMEIAFDGFSQVDPAKLKIQTYELRVDSANNHVDVYSINKNGLAEKILDGLNGTNWATISSVLFVRGLNSDPLGSQWSVTIGGPPQKGPAAGTIMATANAGDSARMSIYANSNSPATQYGWDATGPDGRKADPIDGQNDGRIMGIKFTAGASNALYIDNLYCADTQFANVAPADPEPRTNGHSRLNPFTALTQAVPSSSGPVAGAATWDLY